MDVPDYAEMARRQWRLTFLGGLVLVPVFSLVAAWAMSSLTMAAALAKAGDIMLSAAGLCLAIAGAGALPAWLAGGLRLRPMQWLFEAARGGGIFNWVLVLGGTLLLFEATVLLGALLLHLLDYRVAYRALWSICTGFSLPWLLASLWASWRVVHETKSS